MIEEDKNLCLLILGTVFEVLSAISKDENLFLC